jgi:hypothetical protein
MTSRPRLPGAISASPINCQTVAIVVVFERATSGSWTWDEAVSG